MGTGIVATEFDWKFFAALLSVLVALSAYIGNVRREMIKRCSALKDEIRKAEREKYVTVDAARISLLDETISCNAAEKEKQERRIAELVLADAPLILAAIVVFVQLLHDYPYGHAPWMVTAGLFLGAVAVMFMALHHGREWKKSYERTGDRKCAAQALLVLVAAILTTLVVAYLVSRPDESSREKEAQSRLDALRVELSRVRSRFAGLAQEQRATAAALGALKAEVAELSALARNLEAQLEEHPPSRVPDRDDKSDR